MSNIQLIEQLPVRGEFQIDLIQDGVVTSLPVDPNMIVYSGRTAVAASLMNTSQSYISTIVFGRMGSTEIVTPEMIAIPNILSTTPTDFTMRVLDGSTALPPRIQYIITIPESGMNDKTFNCAALMLSNGKPFAIKKFGDISKTPAMGLSITWTIYV